MACAAQFMVVLDLTIVNVALPSVQKSLHLGMVPLQWVVTAYTLAFGGFLLLGGRAGDLLGQYRVLLGGLTLFGVASLVGGLAQGEAQLIGARGVQGLGAALLSPSTLSVINVTFAEGKQRTKALGAWSAVAGIGGAVGVLLGGVLTDLVGWRWVLLINVPMAVAVAVLCAGSAVPRRGAARVSLDLPGAVLGTLGLLALTYGVTGSDTHGWASTQTLVSLAVAALLLVSFVLVELRTAQPVVRFGVLRSRSVAGGNLVGLLLGATMIVCFYFVSLYLQRTLSWSPLKTGLSFLPFSFGIFAGTVIASKLLPRTGPRLLLLAGLPVAAAGSLWFGQAGVGGTFLGTLLGPSMLVSIGLGICMVSMTVAATSGVAPEEAGLASGLLNTSRQVGGAVGLAALATVASSHTRDQLQAGHDQATATVAGYDLTFVVAALLFVAAAVCAVMIPRPRPEPERTSEDEPSGRPPAGRPAYDRT
ncbi:MFS transporter [Streptomyces sp. MspMP-M5]|uniref:MFS transporter n=1 Tax=unclassified Streptomyces TaxID=2593676 RepID=UPI0022773918|nr:MFS transporter [Streptomyces sp. MspMP-M5]